MIALLILPILISGFIVCSKHLFFSYRLYRYEGQLLYLKCATLGSACFIFTTFFVLTINSTLPCNLNIFSHVICIDIIHYISTLLKNSIGGKDFEINRLSWFLTISILSIGTAYLWTLIYTFRLIIKTGSLENAKIYSMAKVLSDSPLDNALLTSYLRAKPIMLTLDNGKVYVGVISSLGEPTENEGMDQEIALLPIMSGYRDSLSKTITFTTDYTYLGDDNEQGSELDVIIKQDKILTSSWFDFDVYDQLNPT